MLREGSSDDTDDWEMTIDEPAIVRRLGTSIGQMSSSACSVSRSAACSGAEPHYSYSGTAACAEISLNFAGGCCNKNDNCVFGTPKA